MTTKMKTKRKTTDPMVVIARDVIARLNAKTFVAKAGWGFLGRRLKKKERNPDADARTVLKGKKCEGCARGALFLAKLDRQNSLKLADLGICAVDPNEDAYCDNTEEDGAQTIGVDRHTTTEYLHEFVPDQLRLIEAAFERDPQDGYEDEFAAIQFGEKFKTPSKRLRAICENIIKNKGEFRPQDEV